MSRSIKPICAAVLVIAILSAAACTGKDIHIETEPVKLRFLFPYPQFDHPRFKGMHDLYLEAAREFNESNPHITVTLEYLAENEVLKTRLQNDNSPDIVTYWDSGIPEIEEALVDLLPMQQASSESDADPNLIELARYNGKLPLMPYSFITYAVIYNKDFFDRAKIPYPQEDWTWEQYREISNKLDGRTLFAYLPATLNLLMASLGQSIVSPDGTTSVGYLDSPEAVRALQWLNGYLHDNPARAAPDGGLGSNSQFSERQTGMELGNNLSYSFYTTEFKDQADRIGVAPLPYFEGGKKANLVSFEGYGISAKSKHPQEAWAFIEHLTKEYENFVKFGDYHLTADKTGSEAVMQNKDPAKTVFQNEMNNSIKQPLIADVWRNPELNRAFQELYDASDEELPDELHQLALRVDEELARLRTEKDQIAENAVP